MTTPVSDFSDEELVAYLEERLCETESARLEKAMRDSADLRVRASQLLGNQSEEGVSPGAVWARHGLSCPDRTTWSSYLLGLLDDPELVRYAQFHLETVGCRRCRANVEELQTAMTGDPQREERQRRHFESSIGRLRQIIDR
jgi:hypothetical protein